jgi:hypothetical protein
MKTLSGIILCLILLSSAGYAFMSDAFIGDTPNKFEVGTTSLIGGGYFAYERTLTGECSVTIFNKAQPRDAYIVLLNYHPDFTDLSAVCINKQLWGYKINNMSSPFIALAVSGGVISGTYRDTSGNTDKFANKTSLEIGSEFSTRGIIFVPIKFSYGLYCADNSTYVKCAGSISIFKDIEFLITEWTRTIFSGGFYNMQETDEEHYVSSGVLFKW